MLAVNSYLFPCSSDNMFISTCRAQCSHQDCRKGRTDLQEDAYVDIYSIGQIQYRLFYAMLADPSNIYIILDCRNKEVLVRCNKNSSCCMHISHIGDTTVSFYNWSTTFMYPLEQFPLMYSRKPSTNSYYSLLPLCIYIFVNVCVSVCLLPIGA